MAEDVTRWRLGSGSAMIERMRAATTLLFFLLLAFAAAAFGALFPPGAWYAALAKPTWTPPSWLFGPVWTVLYLMIGIAGWKLWRAGRPARAALVLWAAQLTLNAAWSWVFFGLRAPGPALIEILVLWASIVATMAVARRSCRPAVWWLTPYLLWVTFAAALNAAIWRLA